MDLTVGNPVKMILRFALPIFLSQVFQQLYNTADTFIVGRFLGTEALAAVSSSGTLIFLLTSFFIGSSMGAGVVISKYFGANENTRVSNAIHTNIAFGLVSSVLLTVIGVTLTPIFLGWMNTDADVMPQAVEYFRHYFMGATAFVMYNICMGIMNAVGDSKRPLYYLIFSSLLNISLDVLFIGVFNWGVWAAATATVISQATSFVLCLVHLMQKGHIYTVDIKKIRFHKDMLLEILKYGLPAGVQNSVIAFANVIVQSQINSFGKLAMAAYGTHAKIEGFAFLPITSFSMTMSTFVSQNLGAKKYDRAKKGAKFAIFSAVGFAETIGIICYIFAPSFISLFDKNPKVIEYGVTQAHTVALFYFLLAFSHIIAALCRGAGKAIVPMIIMLSVWCVLRVSYIALIMHFINKIEFIYTAYPLTWAISSIIYLTYYLRSDWLHGFESKKNLAEK
ncbi:MAG: MATE family efflux transporter [Clostridia bacterium]|nr:MATE family efflux transporter [Clostridia bacterium]